MRLPATSKPQANAPVLTNCIAVEMCRMMATMSMSPFDLSLDVAKSRVEMVSQPNELIRSASLRTLPDKTAKHAPKAHHLIALSNAPAIAPSLMLKSVAIAPVFKSNRLAITHRCIAADASNNCFDLSACNRRPCCTN
ncbi:hypothetical protein BSY18_4113 (plasmid) [Blastomonas sp. RAC04]|nr:hypothetical protein BSY18_4113 [Blastomonas sp. RAC04]